MMSKCACNPCTHGLDDYCSGTISKYAKLTPSIQRALTESRDLAMRNTMVARIPECADFGVIAQGLDFIINELGIDNEKNS